MAKGLKKWQWAALTPLLITVGAGIGFDLALGAWLFVIHATRFIVQ